MPVCYNRYSDFLQHKYGTKVYKLPINLPLTCPNRDGQVAFLGCIFCGEDGAGFDSCTGHLSVTQQMQIHSKKMEKMYHAKQFIAYFQNFSNTYMSLSQFKEVMQEAAAQDTVKIVELAIATRPDCINNAYLDVLKKISKEKNIFVTIELGMQTSNYHTLAACNRGHGLAEMVDAVLRIKSYGFSVCAHVILNLPGDNLQDTIETAKLISVLGIDFVKLHALYVLKNTVLAKMYEEQAFCMIELSEYMERVVVFLEHLAPSTVIGRIIGRAPRECALFANWNTSWWKIHDDILAKMQNEGRYQGRLFHYTNGSAVKHLLSK